MKSNIKKIQGLEMKLIEGDVKVTLSWIGEGLEGDYDFLVLDDIPLLRMDVFARKNLKNPYAEDTGGMWCYMLDSSYCTQLIAFDKVTAKKALKYIMEEVKDEVIAGHSIKKLCERLSWIDKEMVDKA